MTYPNEYYNVRMTKRELVSNVFYNQKNKIKLVPNLPNKKIYRITDDQAQILFMTLMSRIESL
jgi:hypothetical protein